MKKFRKALAIILAVIMVAAIAPVSAFAATEVEEINVYLDELCGYDVEDWDTYGFVFTDGVYFDDMNGDPAVFAYDEDDNEVSFFESNTTYQLYIYFVADEENGYYLPDAETIPVYLNDEEYEGSITYFYDTYYGVELCIEYTTADWGSNAIDYVDVDVNPTTGDKIGDWENYVTFNTENVYFDDDNGFPGVYVYDSYTGEEIDARCYFTEDRVYDIYVQAAPGKDYYFLVSGFTADVNGEEASDSYVSSYYDEDTYSILIQYADIAAYEIEAEGSTTLIQRIHNFIINLIVRIEEFFSFGMFF